MDEGGIIMKIAFAKLNGKTVLSLNTKDYNRGTRLRLGVFNQLIRLGHEIKIYTEAIRVQPSLFEEEPFLNMQIDYKTNNIDADLLFIENGSANPLYKYKVNGVEVSYLERIREILRNYKGKVIYYQQDGRLSFPFSHFKEDFFSDKQWTILIHATDIETFKETEYKNVYDKLKFKYLPLCFDEYTYPSIKTNSKPENDLVYIGNQHDSNRTKKLLNFYDIPNKKIKLFGNWDKSPSENINFDVNVEPFGKTIRLYNTAKCVIQIGDKNFEKYKMPTTRIIEVIQSGTPLLIDSDIDLPDYIDDIYKVSNSYEVEAWLEKFKDYEVRKKVNEEQRLKLKRWSEVDWNTII